MHSKNTHKQKKQIGNTSYLFLKASVFSAKLLFNEKNGHLSALSSYIY